MHRFAALSVAVPLVLALAACSGESDGAADAPSEQAATGPLDIKHFMSALSVADIEAETTFFTDVLNFEVVKDVPLGEEMHFRWLRNGTQGIELVQMAGSQPGPKREAPPAHLLVRGPGQLMMEVADLEATKAALAEKGVKPDVDITDVAPLGIKVMFVMDPEGNPIELVEVKEAESAPAEGAEG